MNEWKQFKYNRRLEILLRYLRSYCNHLGWKLNINEMGCVMSRDDVTMNVEFTKLYSVHLTIITPSGRTNDLYDTSAEFIDDLSDE